MKKEAQNSTCDASRNSAGVLWLALIIFSACVLMAALPSASFARASESSRRLAMPAPADRGPIFSNDRFRIEGRLGLGSQYLNDEFNQGTNAAFGAAAKIKYKFLDSLWVDSETFIQFSSERFQSQFDSDDFANGFNAKKFELTFRPIKYFQMGFLGVNQKEFISAPLLVSNRAFPGAYQQINIGGTHKKDWCNCLQIRAGQFVPTSRSFDSDRQEKEEEPFFSTIGARAVLSPNKHIAFAPHFLSYRYQNLPSIVAFRSRTRGNTVLGETAPDSVFGYNFEGYVTGADLTIRPTNYFKVLFSFQAIENEAAPESVNSGRLAFIKPSLRIGQVNLKPIAGAYYNEPDTAPAFYNDGDFGHNNREGTFYGLDVDFNKYNFRLRSRLVQANVINEDEFNFQTDQTYAVITLETMYVTF